MKKTVFDGQVCHIPHKNGKPHGLPAENFMAEVEHKKIVNSIYATDLKYKAGQKVRIKKRVVKDGRTAAFWAGAVCEVITAVTSKILNENFYMVAHINGEVDTFRESELDLRFRKKPD
jgi:hypothetical protein